MAFSMPTSTYSLFGQTGSNTGQSYGIGVDRNNLFVNLVWHHGRSREGIACILWIALADAGEGMKQTDKCPMFSSGLGISARAM